MQPREELLAAEERGWRELNDLIRPLEPDELEVAVDGGASWTVKDLMWHVACWSAEAFETLERIRAGTYDGSHESWDATEDLNARWLEQSRALDVRTVKAAWFATRTEMVEAFGTLPQVTPDAFEWFGETGPRHYADHLGDLKRWSERLRASRMRGADEARP